MFSNKLTEQTKRDLIPPKDYRTGLQIVSEQEGFPGPSSVSLETKYF